MLVDLAIGDAYGAAFEYADEMQQYNNLERYYQHPRHLKLGPGMYTDDTQMSIAVAEAMISGEPWTKETLAKYFVNCFKRDWRDGYARGFQKFLESIESWPEFLEKIKPYSDKSGAAMRATPVGFFKDIQEVLDKARIQAQLTHDTADGICAAQASALASHYFIYTLGSKNDLGKFLDKHVPGYDWDKDWEGKVKSKGWMSVKAAVTAIKRNTTQSDLLKDCINFKGDTDTVATIALGATAMSPQHLPDLVLSREHPLFLGLENGAYGRDYLIDLDRKLIKKFGVE